GNDRLCYEVGVVNPSQKPAQRNTPVTHVTAAVESKLLKSGAQVSTINHTVQCCASQVRRHPLRCSAIRCPETKMSSCLIPWIKSLFSSQRKQQKALRSKTADLN